MKYKANITRWRLEPKDEDREKYLRGEFVEPKKPIIIYIDPVTPKKWVPYLIQGVNDWQAAFEKAGSVSYTHLDVYKRQVGVTIRLDGHSTGVITDINGCSVLTLPEKGGLVIYCLLYTSRCV